MACRFAGRCRYGGHFAAYALVSSIFNSEEKIDAPMSTDARTVSDNKESNKTEQSSDANSSIQETTEPPVAWTAGF